MRSRNYIRVITLCLALILLIGAAVPSAAAAPAQVPFAELERGRIDLAEVDELIAQAMALSVNAENQDAVRELVLAMDAWSEKAATWYTFDMIAFYQNTADEAAQEAYGLAGEAFSEGNARILACWRDLLDTACGDVVRELLPPEELTQLESGELEQQVALGAINDRYAEAFEAVHAETYETSEALMLAVGTLYLEMIGEIKALTGSGEEAVRLYYERCGRSGSYADYEPMRAAVREQLAPIMVDLWLTVDPVEGGPESGEDALAQIVSIADREFPELAEAAKYMQTYGYYDITPGESKFDGGFTTYLPLYDAPYLFLPTQGGVDAVSGISHELGHYLDFYTYGGTDDLDSCEVHSQGLELLYTLYYDELFGEEADAAEIEQISGVLWSVTTGCLLDEFQYQAFVNTPESPEQLQLLYLDLLSQYGIEAFALFQGVNMFWVNVPHSFSNPMYYLSYAISALPALEIWAIAQNDPAYAKACYSDFCVLSNQNGFENGLRGAQLQSPKNGTSAAATQASLQPLLLRDDLWMFADIAGCWGATEMQLMGLMGISTGYTDGTFRPAQTLTRAQTAKFVWNLIGREVAVDPLAVDVPEQHWAYDAVQFAVALGLMPLDENGCFGPNEAMTREELASLMYNILCLIGYVWDGTGTEFSDADQIGEENLAAVQAMHELGMMCGYNDGSFRPDAQLTRQQMAVVLSRFCVWLVMP